MSNKHHDDAHPQDDSAALLRHLLDFEDAAAGSGDGIAAAAAGPQPLSYSQQRLWLQQQVEPESPAYNIARALRLRGSLNLEAMRAALHALVQRHAVLRTRFFIDPNGEPRQQVMDALGLPILDHDLRGVADADGVWRVELQRLAATPFVLDAPPLMRAVLWQIGDGDAVLALVSHHLVSDAWSNPIVARDLAQAYRAALAGREPAWAPLPLQYADYAVWQRQQVSQGRWQHELDHWLRVVGDVPPALEMPTDFLRASEGARPAGVHRFTLDDETCAALRRCSRERRQSPFVLLLGAWQLLLARHSGQRRFAVGVPHAGRSRPELDDLVGFFVNTLVYVADCAPELCVDEFLARLQRASLDALNHANLPLECVIEQIEFERGAARTPLFQTLFNLRHDDGRSLPSLPALEVTLLEGYAGEARFDLTLDVSESPQGFSASLEYDAALFTADTVQQLGERWQRLLRGLAGDGWRRLGELPLLGAQQRAGLIASGRAQRVEVAAGESLQQRFEQHAARSPQAIALSCEGASLSYGELNARANRLAHRLRAAGAGPERRIGLMAERSFDLVVGLLAILKSGGAYVPLDPAYPAERLRHIVDDGEVSLVLAQPHLQSALPQTGAVVIALDAQAAAGESEHDPAPLTRPDHLAYVIYTSGSTGKPKGALLTHRNVLRLFAATDAPFGFGAQDVWTLFHSYAFDFSVWEIFGALLYGGRLVIVPQEVSRSPETFAELLVRERVSVLNQTPSAFRPLMQTLLALPPERAPQHLRYVIFGGEAQQAAALQPWFERHGEQVPQLVNMYGITETTVHVTLQRLSREHADTGVTPIGAPIADLSLHLLDADLEPVPDGVTAELYVGGEGLARGYHRRAGLSAQRFVPDPYGAPGARLYRSGDLARRRSDGVVEYRGRADQQLKIRGFRIEPGEIEARLLEQAGVREAAVLVHQGATGAQLAAYVVANVSAETLRAALQASLPEHLVPAYIRVLDVFPLTANGKLDRKALPGPAAAARDYREPGSEAERTLADIWQTLLKLPRMGLDDHFFELGGDSIVAIQLVGRARACGLQLTPRDVFHNPRLQAMAAAARTERVIVIDQAPASGEVPLTPIQHWFFEQPIPRRQHWNQALLLRATRRLAPDRLAASLRQLLMHHDALRMRFSRQSSAWTQHYASAEAAADLLWRYEVADAGQIERLCSEAQASLNLEQGPLLRAVLMQLPDGSQRLLLAIHHLVIDGVSWRILLEDLQASYDGQALPPRSSSYQAWSEQLQNYARSPQLQEQAAWWRAQTPPAVARADRPQTEAGSLTVTLDRERTRQLLQEAPAAYRTQVDELLLTAVARAWCTCRSEATLHVALEGHGREGLFEDLDLTRSLGWFTSLFPLLLRPAVDIADSIKAIKEQLRAVPGKGLGYGVLRYLGDADVGARTRPPLSFNYLGQLDAGFGAGALLAPASEDSGHSCDAQAPLDHSLVVNARVLNGELTLRWRYDAGHDAASVRALAERCHDELVRLIEHCLADGAGGITPSDVSHLNLDQSALDALLGDLL